MAPARRAHRIILSLALASLFPLATPPALADQVALAPAMFPFKDGTKGWGYLGVDGKPLIAPAWQRAMPFSEGLAAIKRDDLWGYIATDGREVVAPQYQTAGDFHDGRAMVEKREGTLTGFIDPTGKLVIDAEKLGLVRGDEFSGGLALAVAKSRLSGYVDVSGKLVIPAQLSSATRFAGGRAYVTTQDGKAGFIDTTGKLVIALPAKAQVGVFREDLCYVQQEDGRHTYLRPDGSVAFTVAVAEGEKPAFAEHHEGRAAFRVKDRWGFLDASGQVVIKPKFTGVLPFSGGLAAVWDAKNKVGFVDASGKLVVKHKYTDGQSYRDGLARVENGKKGWVYIDRKGKVIAKVE